MPWDRCFSSSSSVQMNWPFFPRQMAVPVSWQPGRTPLAAMVAFCSRLCAVNLSLSDASGSCMILASWARCPGRRKCSTSAIARSASLCNTQGSTMTTACLRPPGTGISVTETPFSSSSRRVHGTSTGVADSKSGWYANSSYFAGPMSSTSLDLALSPQAHAWQALLPPPPAAGATPKTASPCLASSASCLASSFCGTITPGVKALPWSLPSPVPLAQALPI
mmetsp:Transcript_112583/g.318499  ORF Transcript_112583/g.318499 Transcript_112583/m.318499 type:complete len:222 (-) Transcript_112583:47-712(-)